MQEIVSAVVLKGGMYDGLTVSVEDDLDYIICGEYVYLQDGELFEVLS